MSTDRYIDIIESEIPYGSDRFEAFRDYHGIVPEAFQNAVTSRMTLEQLKDAVNDLEEYSGSSFNEELVELTAELYEDMGIISSETKTFDRTKVYRAPDYNGKGGSSSWQDLKEDVDNALDIIERRARQEHSTRGLQMAFDDFE